MPLKTFRRRNTSKKTTRTRRTITTVSRTRKVRRPRASYKRRTGSSGLGRTIPFPSTFYQRLPYTSLFSGSASSLGTIGNGLYCLNGLYDPDVGGVGHQPLGFDQLCPTIYANYIVHAVKWTVRVYAVHGDALMFGVHVSKNSVLPWTTQEATLESERQRTRIVSPANSHGSVQTISGFTRISNVFGISPSQIKAALSTYGADHSANPSTKAYMMPFWWNTNSSGSTTTFTVQVQLTYYCQFFNPNALAQS